MQSTQHQGSEANSFPRNLFHETAFRISDSHVGGWRQRVGQYGKARASSFTGGEANGLDVPHFCYGTPQAVRGRNATVPTIPPRAFQFPKIGRQRIPDRTLREVQYGLETNLRDIAHEGGSVRAGANPAGQPTCKYSRSDVS